MPAATPPRTVAGVRQVLDVAYPPPLAEQWDTGIGLTCGDPDAFVDTVLLAVDAEPVTVSEAADVGAQLLVTHHPLLFRSVHSVAADTPKGALIHRLLSAGIAHFAAHTNADRATGGVNDALAAALALENVRPLEPAGSEPFDKLVVMVPRADADSLIDALAEAGAGAVGEYSHAAFRVDGTGQFLPSAAARPAVGTPGVLERVDETRVDMVLPRRRRAAVVAALRSAHPYQEPGFDLTEMVRFPSEDTGLGRIGELRRTTTAASFADDVAQALPATISGARLAGNPDRLVRRVAVCGGAGSSLLSKVADAGVDAFVTADLTHHAAAEFVADPVHPVLVDVSHWASEWPWLRSAADLLEGTYGRELTVAVSRQSTDPWTVHSPSPR